MTTQWYVLRSKPNKELILWRELSARGLETFFPRLHVRPANPRNRKIRPYFPGYLFVNTDLEQVGTSAFLWMPYSSGLVSFDGKPATVPDNLVNAIRRHVEQVNAAGSPEAQVAGLKRGEPVMIEDGPFQGHEAIFDTSLPGRERVRVLLKLLQRREVNVELPASQISSLRRRQKRR
jgi:transcription antitermination factor NusG